MANNIVVFDFFGLPGCGKSVCSHEFSKLMAQDGLRINELTYNMDHRHRILSRFLLKTMYALMFQMKYFKQAQAVKRLLRYYIPNKTFVFNQQLRNVLYKLYLTFTNRCQFVIMDEGFAQAVISITAENQHSPYKLYHQLLECIPEGMAYYPVYIETDINNSISNMDSRKSNGSRAEKISDIDERKDFLKRFESKIKSLSVMSKFTINNDGTLSPFQMARNLYTHLLHIGIIKSSDGRADFL